MQNFRCTKWFLRHSWWRKLNPESAATQDAELNDLPDRVNNPNDYKNSNNRAYKPHVDLYTGTSWFILDTTIDIYMYVHLIQQLELVMHRYGIL